MNFYNIRGKEDVWWQKRDEDKRPKGVQESGTLILSERLEKALS